MLLAARLRTSACTAAVILSFAPFASTASQEPPPAGAESGPQPLGTLSDLTVTIIYPAPDAIFHIAARSPENQVEWTDLQPRTPVLAESAHRHYRPGYGRRCAPPR
jgi:hypothetical protein